MSTLIVLFVFLALLFMVVSGLILAMMVFNKTHTRIFKVIFISWATIFALMFCSGLAVGMTPRFLQILHCGQ